MSSFIKWTQHPDTMHWHHAYWIDDHFGHHHYGVRFNDGTIFDPEQYEMRTIIDESDIPSDEIIDRTRDQYAEVFGRKQTAAESSGDAEPEKPKYICCDMLEKALGDHRGLYSQTIGKLGSDEIDEVIMYVGGDYKYSTGPAVVQFCPFCGKPRIRASEAR